MSKHRLTPRNLYHESTVWTGGHHCWWRGKEPLVKLDRQIEVGELFE